jgi:hypothetical protein
MTHIYDAEGASISYIAHKYEEDEHTWLGQIQISVISIKYDIEHLLRPADGDRIALQCGEYRVERCQMIDRQLVRRCWTSGPTEHHRWQYPIHMIGDPVDSPEYSNPCHLLPILVGKEQQFALLNYRYTPPTIVPFLVRFDMMPLPQSSPPLIDGSNRSIVKRRLRHATIKYQVYSLRKQIEDQFVVTFYYTFVRSLVQIQLIELIPLVISVH